MLRTTVGGLGAGIGGITAGSGSDRGVKGGDRLITGGCAAASPVGAALVDGGASGFDPPCVRTCPAGLAVKGVAAAGTRLDAGNVAGGAAPASMHR